MTRRNAGFTLTELIVVIVLLGILAVYVVPRFTGHDGFSELTVQQDLIQSIRFAQQLAMSRTDRTITLVTSANQINVLDGGNSAQGYPKNIPDDVTLDAVNLVFNGMGSAGNADTTINVNVSGTQVLTVTVEGATGYAH